MKLKKITWQHGPDFYGIMECEFCGHEEELKSGYNDHFYHSQVIPSMVCEKCKKSTKQNDTPIAANNEPTFAMNVPVPR